MAMKTGKYFQHITKHHNYRCYLLSKKLYLNNISNMNFYPTNAVTNKQFIEKNLNNRRTLLFFILNKKIHTDSWKTLKFESLKTFLKVLT